MTKVEEAQEILAALGLPPAQQNEISAYTLLALCGLTSETPWKKAKRQSLTIRKGIMEFVNTNYRSYAENTRETFRRQVLHQFVQAGIVDHNPDNPYLPTNSSLNHYSLAEDAMPAIRSYGTPRWRKTVEQFVARHGKLIDAYYGRRKKCLIPLALPDGRAVALSPGKHNELQVLVLTEFAPRFASGSCLLYLGDTAQKDIGLDALGLSRLGISAEVHGKLPDIVLYDEKRRWIFLVEAVTSHGPMSPKRINELQALLSNCTAEAVFVTAFHDFKGFKQYAGSIAWETEVWIAELPDHLIHYNGDRFLGPR